MCVCVSLKRIADLSLLPGICQTAQDDESFTMAELMPQLFYTRANHLLAQSLIFLITKENGLPLQLTCAKFN